MRSIRFLSIAFLLLAGFLNLTAADRKVTFPSYNILLDEKGNKVKGSEIDFRIVEVEVTSDKTIISCEQKFLQRVKAFFTIAEDCSIFYKIADGVVQSYIKASENMEIHKIGMNRPEKMPTHKPGEIMSFKMIFDPIPEGVDSFDLIEKFESRWNGVDISLVNGTPSRDEQKIGTCPFGDVITRPKFLGEHQNFFAQCVNKHLVYPENLRQYGLEGLVGIKITIDADGSASYKIVRHSKPEFDAEAMRVVKKFPTWTPATIRGKAVKCTLRFPVIFQLK